MNNYIKIKLFYVYLYALIYNLPFLILKYQEYF